jgi:hypothetical protein
VGSSLSEMWVARRQWCLAFVVSGDRLLVRDRKEGRGKREICLKMFEESVFNMGREREKERDDSCDACVF